MSTLLSIIIPVYNVEKYIERCIHSITSQSFADWELILVNDGSTDNSGFICQKKADLDGRIKVIHNKNHGVSHARNAGLKIASGQYIYFADSDDELASGSFSHFIEIEERYKVSLYKFGYSRRSTESEIKISAKMEGEFNRSRALYILEKNGYSGFLWNSIFKKSIIDKYSLKFDETISWCEDHLFFLEYLTCCKSVYISSLIYYIYYVGINEKSLSKKIINPYIILDIGLREYKWKAICNNPVCSSMTTYNSIGYRHKCIHAIKSGIKSKWSLKQLALLFDNIHEVGLLQNNVYFLNNKIIYYLYCISQRLKFQLSY